MALQPLPEQKTSGGRAHLQAVPVGDCDATRRPGTSSAHGSQEAEPDREPQPAGFAVNSDAVTRSGALASDRNSEQSVRRPRCPPGIDGAPDLPEPMSARREDELAIRVTMANGNGYREPAPVGRPAWAWLIELRFTQPSSAVACGTRTGPCPGADDPDCTAGADREELSVWLPCERWRPVQGVQRYFRPDLNETGAVDPDLVDGASWPLRLLTNATCFPSGETTGRVSTAAVSLLRSTALPVGVDAVDLARRPTARGRRRRRSAKPLTRGRRQGRTGSRARPLTRVTTLWTWFQARRRANGALTIFGLLGGRCGFRRLFGLRLGSPFCGFCSVFFAALACPPPLRLRRRRRLLRPPPCFGAGRFSASASATSWIVPSRSRASSISFVDRGV